MYFLTANGTDEHNIVTKSDDLESLKKLALDLNEEYDVKIYNEKWELVWTR